MKPQHSIRGFTWLLALSSLTLGIGCSPTIDDTAGLPIHPELRIQEWRFESSRSTVRAELSITGALNATSLEVDLKRDVLRGAITVPNRDLGTLPAYLRYYAALNDDSDEVLIGEAITEVTIQRDSTTRLRFPTINFEVSDLRFDPNRNGRTSIQDLVNGHNPAPLPNPIVLSPRTLSFDAGVPVGGFTRGFFIISNTADEPVEVTLESQLAAGITLGTLEMISDSGAEIPSTRHVMTLEPGDDQVMAVTFAPSDQRFVVEATYVDVRGIDSNTRYGSLFRLLGNPDGLVPEPPSNYVNPDIVVIARDSTYIGETKSYPVINLFSRSPTEVDNLSEEDSGSIGSTDIDHAHTILVPAGFRLGLTLDGIANDVDLHLFELSPLADLTFEVLDGDDDPTNGTTPRSSSTRGGSAAEVVHFDGTDREQDTYVLVTMDRIPPLTPDDEITHIENEESPITQASLRKTPEAGWVTSTTDCPTVYHTSTTCSPADGFAELKIYGRNFDPGATVRIDGAETICAPVVPGRPESDVPSEQHDQITCISPPSPNDPRQVPRASVVVTNPSGSAATFPEHLTYLPPRPQVYSVGPNRGPREGETLIAINGSHFYQFEERAPKVFFDDFPAEVVSVSPSGETIHVRLPECPTCIVDTLVDVRVTNPDKQSYTASSVFTYFVPDTEAPQITGISPTTGSTQGGFEVTITGTQFTIPTLVRIGTDVTPLNAVDVNTAEDGTAIVVQMPAHPPGATSIEVTNTLGQTHRVDNLFTYLQPSPTVGTVSPSTGLSSGGTPVLILGNHFETGARVFFGTSEATSVVYDSQSALSVITPPAEPGLVDIRIVNLDGQSGELADSFTYIDPVQAAPSLESISPESGPSTGGTEINVQGSDFVEGMRVYLGGQSITDITLDSPTSFRFITPPAALGSAALHVTNPDGQSATMERAFTYTQSPPTMTHVSPHQGPSTGGTVITITGSGFSSQATISFDGIANSSCQIDSSTRATCMTAPHSAGVIPIRLTNPDQQFSDASFEFVATPDAPPPFIAELLPTQGSYRGGTPVEIRGEGFDVNAKVFIGSYELEPLYKALSDAVQVIQILTPPGFPGRSVNIRVQNPDGQASLMPFQFTDQEPGFQVANSIPNRGPFDDATGVLIVGQDFELGARIRLEASTSSFNVDLEDVLWISPSLLSATFPPIGAIEMSTSVNIQVINPDGQTMTLEEGFLYEVPDTSHAVPLIDVEPLLPGDACPNGGRLIVIGLDDGDGDGLANDFMLHPHEADRLVPICNTASNGMSTLHRVAVLPPGGVCPEGGKELAWGQDLDGNGTLDDNEVEHAEPFCVASSGFKVELSTEPIEPGVTCPFGGYRLNAGRDVNNDGSIELVEIETTADLCNAAGSELRITEDAALCDGRGGIIFTSGSDQNGDGVLSEDETTSTSTACQGVSGLSALSETVPASLSDCPSGGYKIKSGLDTNQNRTLENNEVISNVPICNGQNGTPAIAVSEREESLAGCPDDGPGALIRSGVDENRNGTVEENELLSITKICDGRKGADGFTSLIVVESLSSEDTRCAQGSDQGLVYKVGLDLDDDGNLSPDEVGSEQVLCGGESGYNSLIHMLSDAEACGGLGGYRVDLGMDANRDGVLAEDEVTQTEVLCNGMPGLNALTEFDTADTEACPNGGAVLYAGQDADGDGLLSESERLSTKTVFNGIDGRELRLESRPLEDESLCPFSAGQLIVAGYDSDQDGLIDADAEVWTTTLCNGLSGVDTLWVQTPIPPGHPDCAYGGVRLESGADDGKPGGIERNGVLEPLEVDFGTYICNGSGGLDNDAPFINSVSPGSLEPRETNAVTIHGGRFLSPNGDLPALTLGDDAVILEDGSNNTLLLFEAPPLEVPTDLRVGDHFGNTSMRLVIERQDGPATTAYLRYASQSCVDPDFTNPSGACPQGFNCFRGRCRVTFDNDGEAEGIEECDGEDLRDATCADYTDYPPHRVKPDCVDGKIDPSPCFEDDEITPIIDFIRTIDAGNDHVCGIRISGAITCWGDNEYGQLDLALANHGVLVSLGEDVSCGLDTLGGASCVGLNGLGQTEIPNATFRHLDMGPKHGCGVLADRSVTCWGEGSHGQTAVPPDLETNVVEVASGGYHSCALQRDGRLDCWTLSGGAHDEGQARHPQTPYLVTLAGLSLTPGDAVGGGSEARFSNPQGVVFDANGDLLVADTDNHRILHVTKTGVVSIFAGTGSPGATEGERLSATFNSPVGLAWSPNGDLLIADRDNHVIRSISDDDLVSVYAGGVGVPGFTDAPDIGARFSLPVGLAVDAEGTVFVSELGNHAIRVITTDGEVSTLAGGTEGSSDGSGLGASFREPAGLALQADGSLVVADAANHLIRQVSPAGDVTTLAGTGSAGADNGSRLSATFSYPTAVAVDLSGVVWVADRDNAAIRRLSVAGVVDTPLGELGIPGTDDGDGNRAGLYLPSGLAINGDGDLGIVESGNHLVRMMRQTSAFRTITAASHAMCGIRQDETLTCWGSNTFDEATPPTGRFNRVDAGPRHVCALRTDGTIACWGQNTSGQTDAPDGVWVDITSGEDFSCALDATGSVTCWGNLSSNQSIPESDDDGIIEIELPTYVGGYTPGPVLSDDDTDGAPVAIDCDDNDPDTFPGNNEVCDGKDNDCNGLIDDHPTCDALPANCGDGIRTGDEVCDDGYNDACGACNEDCSGPGIEAVCGDGILCPQSERCDDGNLVDTDACTSSCEEARCGDGIVQADVEECDDGNRLETDSCLEGCVAARCGDGVVQEGVEQCDDGGESTFCLANCTPTTDFVATWRTSLPFESITLPLREGYAYDFEIDWGDNTPPSIITSWDDPDRTHVYAAPGSYLTVSTGSLEAFFMNNGPERKKLVAVASLGSVGWRNLEGAFDGCEDLGYVRGGDLSGVTSTAKMFRNARRARPETGYWDTAQVTDMSDMFAGASVAKPVTAGWDTTQVTTMARMFQNATKANPETGAWNTSNVTDMEGLFDGAKTAIPDTSGWDTGQVTNMAALFRNAERARPDTSGWDTTQVTSMAAMFDGADLAEPQTSGWITNQVTSMAEMFRNTRMAHPDTAGWDVSSVTTMESMFEATRSANPDVSTWDLRSVTNLRRIFYEANRASPDTSNWDTGQVQTLAESFAHAPQAAPNTGGWDTSQVTDFQGAFENNPIANPDTSAWDTRRATTLASMFRGATAATPNTSTWNTSSVTDMSGLFDGASLAAPDTASWDTANVTTMAAMFRNAPVAEPDTSAWNTQALIDASALFEGASAANPDVSSWDTSKVETLARIFKDASVAVPDTSAWDTATVTTLERSFEGAALADPDVSTWDTSKVTTLAYTFARTTLADPDVSAWDISSVETLQGTFYQAANANPDVAGWDTYGIANMRSTFQQATRALPALSGWDFSEATELSGFLAGIDLGVEAYSALLIKLEEENQNERVTLSGGNAYYNADGATGRFRLIYMHDWRITDGGQIPGGCGDGMVDVYAGEVCDDGGPSELCTELCTLAPAFVTTWQLNEEDTTLTLPLRPGYDYDFTVDWGDGTPASTITSHSDTDRIHVYAEPGTYSVRVQGKLEAWYFNNGGDKDKLIEVPNLGDVGWRSLEGAFDGCSQLEVVRGGITDRVSTMRAMFRNATRARPETQSWDTSGVIDMALMFDNAQDAVPTTGDWNTSRVVSFEAMFRDASLARPDTTTWDTRNATTFRSMFQRATSARPETRYWQTREVRDMAFMFDGAERAAPFTGGWNTARVTSFEAMFQDAVVAQPDTQSWDVSAASEFQSMFKGALRANPDVASWDLSVATNLTSMFEDATSARPETGAWDLSSVTQLERMFKGATSANPDVSAWDIGLVTSVAGLFQGATQALPDMTTWSVGQLLDLSAMFLDSRLPTKEYSDFLVYLRDNNAQTGVTLHGGSSTYNAYGQSARETLINARGWTIEDGGRSVSYCGDGEVNAALGETCDDGNTTTETCAYGEACVVCDSTCQEVPGVYALCGDGIVEESMEACDDGNLITEACPYGEQSCVVCDASCTLAPGATSFCGDGIVNGAETCDTGGASETCSASCQSMASFVSIWRTIADGETITLPLREGFTYNFIVDWGDGTTSEVTSHDDADITHTYATAGYHEVTIDGTMETIYFNNGGDKTKLMSIPNLGAVGWTSFNNAFKGCTSLTSVIGGDLSTVTDMTAMFSYATNVLPNASGWDTSQVTSMSNTFRRARYANPDVSNWDTSAVIAMNDMFREARSARPDVSNWDVRNVEDFSYMFANAYEVDPDLSRWEPASITTASNMFWFVTLPTATYDAFLNQLYTHSPTNNVQLHGGFSKYSIDGATARQALRDERSWTIFDGGRAPFACGDGVVDTDQGETCDDGNAETESCPYNSSCSICNSACILEPITGSYCGDGVIDAEQGEQCDDGNLSDADLCSTTCQKIDDFISVWRTIADGETITLPLRSGFNYNFTVDWGDGTSSEVTSHDDEDITHTYDSPGDHTVTISGTMETIYFNNEGDKDKIISIPNLGSVGWTSFEHAFWGCANLTHVHGGDTSQVTNMNSMFAYATNVTPDTSNWDTSNVTTMQSIFIFATGTNPDTSNWDTSSVTDMERMFHNAANAEPDTSNWNTSNVTDMQFMFYNAIKADPDVSSWDVSNVTNMGHMFNNAIVASLDTSNWNTASVTNMERMFSSATNATPETSNWNTSNVTTMERMFNSAPSASPDTSSWDTSNVINMQFMFADATSATPDTSNWDTSSVTTMRAMFQNATSANPDTSNWNTSSVTDMQYMFSGATLANPDVSGWDVSNVVNMRYMFSQADAATPDLSSWTPSALTNATNMLRLIDIGADAYSDFLVQLAGHNTNTGVVLHGGNAQYNPTGAAARGALVNDRSWVITDGGPVTDTDGDGLSDAEETALGTDPTLVDTDGDGLNDGAEISAGTNPLLGDFVSVWRTTADGETITLPLRSGYTYNFTVQWGDGTSSEVTSHDDEDITHTYATAGDHTVTISGTMETLYFNNSGDKDKIISIPNLGDVGWTSFERAFYGSSNLTSVAGGDLSQVTSLSYMFNEASQVQPLTGGWDTSQVTDMSRIFRNAALANPDVSGWDTSQVQDMSFLFSGARAATPDTSAWDTAQVTNMTALFQSTDVANPDVSSWDVSNVTSLWYMFFQADSATPDFSSWVPSSVTNAGNMLTNDIGVGRYSAFLVQLAAHNTNTGVSLDGGTSQYNATGAIARATLVNERSWSIDDGGRAAFACGDGQVDTDQAETCDDGNLDDGDGCDSSCLIEPICGNSAVEDSEDCDDGNTADDGNGCSATCTRVGSCGDGITQSLFESCDDGNPVDGDGCSNLCQLESNPVTPDGYVLLSSGTFTMGSPESELGRDSNETQHEVTLTNDFYMSDHEVTQAEWEALIGNNPSRENNGTCGTCPVEYVNWWEALHYANALSESEGLTACYILSGCDDNAVGADKECTGVTLQGGSGNTATTPYECEGYRLPTEAEWEYATRAGTTTAFYNGDITSFAGSDPNADTIAWHSGNSDSTHPVKGKTPNAWGLYDMSGNVREWTWDRFGAYSGDAIDPVGPNSGPTCVARGGSWDDALAYTRSAVRLGGDLGGRNGHVGFRLARTVN